MEPQGLDRTALLGILLMSLLLGLWMIQTAPTEEQLAAQQAAADSLAAVEAGRTEALEQADVEAEDALTTPVDSTFAQALGGPEREVTVVTDRVIATFSTRGGTPVSYKLRNYDHAQSDDPVELVSGEEGAIALEVLPRTGGLVDTRALTFRPIVDGQPFEGDTLRIEEGEGDLRFEAPVGSGALRLVYTFHHDAYRLGFRVETPGTDLLAQSGGYDVFWDGALPLAEADPQGEVQQAGAYRRWGDDTDRIRLTEEGEAELEPASGQIDWVAVKTKFFIAAIIPESGTAGARLSGEQVGEVDDAGEEGAFAQHYEARLEMPALGADEAAQFTLYLGPLQLSRLAEYGLYDTVDFGDYIGWMLRPIAQYVVAPVFAFLSTFTSNYGLVIIVFALLVKLVLWPLTAASYRSMAKMRELQPELTAVKEKYGDDPQKQQEAMMRVYREAGVNPLGGCLPMLLQYPLLITLWRFFQSTLVLRGEPFLWAPDLSAPDPILNLPFTIPFYGDFVAGFTLLMGLSMIVSMRLSSTGAVGGQQKVLMYMMPAVFFLFFNGFPSGLSLYYLAFNIFSIVQQRMINKQVHEAHEAGETPEIDRAAAVANKAAGKGKRNGRARRKGGLTSQIVSQNGRSTKKSKK